MWTILKRRVALAAFLALTACDAESMVVPSMSDGLELTVHVDRFDMNAAAIPSFTRSLRNTSDEPLTIVFASCGVLPYIGQLLGGLVYPSGGAWVCGGSVESVTLAPGAALIDRNGISVGPPMPGDVIMLEPGRYRAFAETELRLGGIDGRVVRLRSASVYFQAPRR